MHHHHAYVKVFHLENAPYLVEVRPRHLWELLFYVLHRLRHRNALETKDFDKVVSKCQVAE